MIEFKKAKCKSSYCGTAGAYCDCKPKTKTINGRKK